MSEVTIEELHACLLDMLKMIDTFCTENGISYSLYGGTMLGAVRHQGFIPWDDDVDICMTRDEYERFVDVWEKRGPEGYFLQTADTDLYWHLPWSKIRKEDSVFIEREFQRDWVHNGVFIDIFIIDRMSSHYPRKVIDDIGWIAYLLALKGKLSGHLTKYDWLSARVKRLYRSFFRHQLLRQTTRHRDWPLGDIDSYKNMRRRFGPELADSYIWVLFEDTNLPIFKNYELYLKVMYGDYMVPPPEKERIWKHHPIVLDLGK